MSAFDQLIARAKQKPARVALPEATDTRVINAAISAASDGRCIPVLVGNETSILKSADSASLKGIEIIDTSSPSADDELANALFERRKHKGMTRESAVEALADPLTYALSLIHI